MQKDQTALLVDIFTAAVQAVHPKILVPAYMSKALQNEEFRNIYISGAGKATAAMAAATEQILTNRITDGVIAVKHGHGLPLHHTRQIEAGHPLPDQNSIYATKEIIKLFQKAGPGDLIIFLLSGGASSLLTDLPGNFTLQDLNGLSKQLLNNGADIHEINTVRKQVSAIKGGQIVKYANGANIISLILSDVIGNDLSVIGSGPTVEDSSTPEDAINVIEKYHLDHQIAPAIIDYLKKEREPIKIINTANYKIGDNSVALRAAEKKAQSLGYQTFVFEEFLQGEVEIAVANWINIIKKNNKTSTVCLIAGGETTVSVNGAGLGGRNQHFALAAAAFLKDWPNISLLAAGTDGTDGPTDATGATVNHKTFEHASRLNMDPGEYLLNNDSYHFFEKAGGHIKTGPTQTNVMDVVITLIN